jgi:hypothetical protein
LGITYNASTSTITVTGYTSSVPCTFTDVYNASEAGGWGVVMLQGNQFLLSCKLQIGNGSIATYFSDSKKQISFTNLSGAMITVYSAATVVFGNIVGSLDGDSGCDFYFANTSSIEGIYAAYGQRTAIINLYGCSFASNAEAWIEGTSIFSCKFNYDCYYQHFYTGVNTINDCVFFNSQAMIRNPNSYYGEGLTVTNVFAGSNRNSYGLWFVSSGGTVKGMNFNYDDSQYAFAVDMENVTTSDVYLVNCTFNHWGIRWAGTSTKSVYRQYEFDLMVKDTAENGGGALQNVNVTLKDKNSNIVFSLTTDANGQIATQTVTHGTYSQAYGNTEQLYAPLNLYLSKTGYVTQSIPLALNEKTKLTVSLKKQQTNVFFGLRL